MGLRDVKGRIAKRTATHDKLRVEGEILWATTMAAFMMAAADGRLADEEVEALARAVLEIADEPPGGDDDAITELLDTDLELYERLGFDGCAAEVAKRLPSRELRAATLELAACVAFVDGHLAEEEEVAFERLAAALGFTPEEAEDLAEGAIAAMEDRP